jgi:hypothetical protein
MPGLEQIATFQDRRDERPNQELARDLAQRKDRAVIREIARNLSNPNKNIQADCIKVLYEVGYLNPALIADHAEEFLKLLKSRNNRLVWGGMIALATVAELKAPLIYAHRTDIQKAMEAGSVITVDNGVLALARAASKSPAYNRAIFPYLMKHLKTCRPKDVAQHAEKTLPAVRAADRARFIAVLTRRLTDLSGSGLARVKKVMRAAGQPA